MLIVFIRTNLQWVNNLNQHNRHWVLTIIKVQLYRIIVLTPTARNNYLLAQVALIILCKTKQINIIMEILVMRIIIVITIMVR